MGVCVDVDVAVGVWVGAPGVTGVLVGVAVCVGVRVGVGVRVTVGVCVGVGVAVRMLVVHGAGHTGPGRR